MEDTEKKAKLLNILRECAALSDYENAHVIADNALIEFIDDPEIRNAFDEISKFYA